MKDYLLKKLNRKNITLDYEVVVFPDTFEFEQKAWEADQYNKDMLEELNIDPNSLIILQATRIVKRKSIELTIDLISELNKRKDYLAGKRIYNGKKLGKKFDILLVFAQKEEQDAVVYKERLIRKMKDKGVKYIFIDDRIESRRMKRKGKKIYSLWDSYVHADIVSYPSTWEGFGNQFLEAVFAKKPVILFEYPVFEKDIAQGGYHYISLGNTIEPQAEYFKAVSKESIERAVKATLHMLLDERTTSKMDSNFHKAKQKYGEEQLSHLLEECLYFNV
jgi:glycosyltransferase involved in cell wall biosynthesis